MRALVTGGAHRLGRAIAEKLAENGYSVAIHCNSSVEAAKVVAATTGGFVIAADLTDKAGIDRVISAVNDQWGELDLLVNCAGLWNPKSVDEITSDDWDTMFNLNAKAPMFLSAGLSDLLRRSQDGNIINITDIAGDSPTPKNLHYSASKAALISLTKGLALELAPDIRVNGISPGTILPPVEMPDDQLKEILKTIPLNRAGTAQDIANTALYLALMAPYITGQIIAVDGGRSAASTMVVG
jgi:pteridine reductase